MGWGNFQGLSDEERPLTQLRLATQHGDGSLRWVLEGCGHLEPGRNPHAHPPTPKEGKEQGITMSVEDRSRGSSGAFIHKI